MAPIGDTAIHDDEFAISPAMRLVFLVRESLVGPAGLRAARSGGAGMSLPVRIMAVKAGQPPWTMEARQ
jgi:hypothetical protein